MNMRRLLLFMILAYFCICTFAQSVVTGVVRDTTGAALEGVIVRLMPTKLPLVLQGRQKMGLSRLHSIRRLR